MPLEGRYSLLRTTWQAGRPGKHPHPATTHHLKIHPTTLDEDQTRRLAWVGGNLSSCRAYVVEIALRQLPSSCVALSPPTGSRMVQGQKCRMPVTGLLPLTSSSGHGGTSSPRLKARGIDERA